MINTDELMIGNLLQDRNGRLCEVEQVSKNLEECRIYAIIGATTSLPVQPINLTDDWLLKFGFHQGMNSFVWKKEIQYVGENYPCSLQFTNNGTAMQICRSGIGAACTPCESVHQLQNLIFILTGKQIKI